MNRYSPYLMAIDPTRTSVPVRMRLLSYAAVLLLRTEPQALQTFLQTQNSLPPHVLRAPPPSLLSADAVDMCRLAQELSGPPSMMRIARRAEVLRSFAARVLLATALESAPARVRAMKVNPFLLLCPSSGAVVDGTPRSLAYRTWLGKVWAEQAIAGASDPAATAVTVAALVVRQAMSLGGPFLSASTGRVPSCGDRLQDRQTNPTRKESA